MRNVSYVKSTGGTIIRQSDVSVSPDISVKSGSTLKGQYSTIQSAINAAVSGQDVWVGSGTYTEDLHMKWGVDVRKVYYKPTINGDIIFDGVNNSTLADFFVDGTVRVEDSEVTLDGITSESDDDTALVVLDYSFVDVIDFKSTDRVDMGIYAYGDAYLILDGIEITRTDKALKEYYADVDLYCSYFCDNDYDIYKISSSIYIEEYENTFSGTLQDVTYGLYPHEYIAYYDICGLKKTISDQSSERSAPSTGNTPSSTFENEAFNRGMSLIREIDRQRIAAIRADSTWNVQNFAGQYAEATGLLKQAVAESYEDEWVWKSAINKILSSYWRLGQSEEVYKYLNTFRDDARYAELRPYVDRRLMSYYMHQGDPSKALQLADTLLASPLDEQQRVGVLYQIGNIYWRYLNDPSQAAVYFWQLVVDYPDNPVTESALAQLASMGESVPGDAPTEPETVEDLALEGYPNPFNPTATIRFGLPKGGNVTLVVYDLMGREVATLVDRYIEPGHHQIVWNGKYSTGDYVPSGIYIARLSIIPPTAGVTPEYTKSIKMLMLK